LLEPTAYIAKRSLGIIQTIISANKSQQKTKNQIHNFKNNPESNTENAHEFSSSFGYSNEDAELATLLQYKTQIDKKKTDDHSESGKLYDHALEAISSLLNEDGAIQKVFNFGVSYAYIDSLLADKFPKTNFVGIDRSIYTKCVNDALFKTSGNLEIIFGDVFDVLKNNNFDGCIFFHTRTLVLLPEDFIKRLYKAVELAGFKYIVCIEQIGVSRFTNEPYEFSITPQNSIPFRDGMYIHNYPGLIDEAGYQIKKSQLIKTNHPHPDYRFLSIIAEKSSPSS